MTTLALKFEDPPNMRDPLQCGGCGQIKSEDDFYCNSGKLDTSKCKDCKKNSVNAYREEFPELERERVRAYRASGARLGKDRAYHLRVNYKMTIEDYARMLEEQGGVCKLCSTDDPAPNPNFSVDHDHACCPGPKSCGECVRGLVCMKCNFVLGYVENYISVEKLAAYL